MARSTAAGIAIIYDGECPFCRNFVRLMALKKAVGSVDLIDARTPHPIVRQLTDLGYDLNEGMAAIYGDKIYHGSDAVVLVSSLTDTKGIVARGVAALLRNPRRANFLYPGMKRGRGLALRLLGKSAI